MYDIFSTNHTTYDKKRVSNLVLKCRALKNLNTVIIEKNLENTKNLNRVKNRQTKVLIEIIKRKQSTDEDVRIANVKKGLNDKYVAKLNMLEKRGNIDLRMNEDKLQALKLELFNMMSKVIVKNINNYLNLAFNSPVKEQCYERDEMQAEAWLILDNCIDKFLLNPKYCFYFYYNKALGRNFYRMFTQTISVNNKHKEYVGEKLYTSDTYKTDNSAGMNILLDSLNLPEKERKVLDSKLKREKKSVFLTNNPDMSPGKYYGSLKNIKEVVTNFRDNGQL